MSQFQDIQTFIDLINRARGPNDLHDAMQGIAGEMGFDHYALIHHVDVRPQGQAALAPSLDGPIAMTNYPWEWVAEYIADGIIHRDPILQACRRTGAGFSWDRVPELVSLTPTHLDIIERGRKGGIVDGYTVPVHVPGEPPGSCTFAVGHRRAAPRANYPMAHLIGAMAFEAARTLHAEGRRQAGAEAIRLTDRQVDCVELVARGKTDWEIGRILGISEETVKQYLKDARQRYNVTKRVQLVLCALQDGLIPLVNPFP